jgi:hypothetical protein
VKSALGETSRKGVSPRPDLLERHLWPGRQRFVTAASLASGPTPLIFPDASRLWGLIRPRPKRRGANRIAGRKGCYRQLSSAASMTEARFGPTCSISRLDGTIGLLFQRNPPEVRKATRKHCGPAPSNRNAAAYCNNPVNWQSRKDFESRLGHVFHTTARSENCGLQRGGMCRITSNIAFVPHPKCQNALYLLSLCPSLNSPEA